MTTSTDIVRCLRYEGYTPERAALYCRKVAMGSRFNPFDVSGQSLAYLEAARAFDAAHNAELGVKSDNAAS